MMSPKEDPDQGYVIKFLIFRFLVYHNRKLKVNSIPIVWRGCCWRGRKLTEKGFSCLVLKDIEVFYWTVNGTLGGLRLDPLSQLPIQM